MLYLLAVVVGLIIGALMMRSFIRAQMKVFAAKRVRIIDDLTFKTRSDTRGAEHLKFELRSEAAAWRSMYGDL